jgi:hypothetical protein
MGVVWWCVELIRNDLLLFVDSIRDLQYQHQLSALMVASTTSTSTSNLSASTVSNHLPIIIVPAFPAAIPCQHTFSMWTGDINKTAEKCTSLPINPSLIAFRLHRHRHCCENKIEPSPKLPLGVGGVSQTHHHPYCDHHPLHRAIYNINASSYHHNSLPSGNRRVMDESRNF